jgi:hypothetical protein
MPRIEFGAFGIVTRWLSTYYVSPDLRFCDCEQTYHKMMWFFVGRSNNIYRAMLQSVREWKQAETD